jgi:hypothetical protein
VDAWLVTDERAELIREIRTLARKSDLVPEVACFTGKGGALRIRPLPVVHTSHPTYGYRIDVDAVRIAWLPEFFEVPDWIQDFDLVFADGAGWSRPILFAHGTGGHACVLDVAREAQALGVRRLVFAHIGRPSIRALAAGERPPFGEMGFDGQRFTIRGAALGRIRRGQRRSTPVLDVSRDRRLGSRSQAIQDHARRRGLTTKPSRFGPTTRSSRTSERGR